MTRLEAAQKLIEILREENENLRSYAPKAYSVPIEKANEIIFLKSIINNQYIKQE